VAVSVVAEAVVFFSIHSLCHHSRYHRAQTVPDRPDPLEFFLPAGGLVLLLLQNQQLQQQQQLSPVGSVITASDPTAVALTPPPSTSARAALMNVVGG